MVCCFRALRDKRQPLLEPEPAGVRDALDDEGKGYLNRRIRLNGDLGGAALDGPQVDNVGWDTRGGIFGSWRLPISSLESLWVRLARARPSTRKRRGEVPEPWNKEPPPALKPATGFQQLPRLCLLLSGTERVLTMFPVILYILPGGSSQIVSTPILA